MHLSVQCWLQSGIIKRFMLCQQSNCQYKVYYWRRGGNIYLKFNIRIVGRDYCYGRDSPFCFFKPREGERKLKGKEVNTGIRKPIYRQNKVTRKFKLWLEILENKQNPRLHNFWLQCIWSLPKNRAYHRAWPGFFPLRNGRTAICQGKTVL